MSILVPLSFRMSFMDVCVDSHHASSSLVYVGMGHRSGEANRPGFVRNYVKVTVLLNLSPATPSQSTQLPSEMESPNLPPRRVTVHLAAVNWLDVHPCKDWFGTPVEVWQKPIRHCQSDTFVPVTDIVCRCAHTTKKVRFNRILEEEITAVVPLNHFCGL